MTEKEIHQGEPLLVLVYGDDGVALQCYQTYPAVQNNGSCGRILCNWWTRLKFMSQKQTEGQRPETMYCSVESSSVFMRVLKSTSSFSNTEHNFTLALSPLPTQNKRFSSYKYYYVLMVFKLWMLLPVTRFPAVIPRFWFQSNLFTDVNKRPLRHHFTVF